MDWELTSAAARREANRISPQQNLICMPVDNDWHACWCLQLTVANLPQAAGGGAPLQPQSDARRPPPWSLSSLSLKRFPDSVFVFGAGYLCHQGFQFHWYIITQFSHNYKSCLLLRIIFNGTFSFFSKLNSSDG